MNTSFTILLPILSALYLFTSLADAKKDVWITASNIPDETMSQLQIRVDGKIIPHQFSKRQAGNSLTIPDDGLFQVVMKKPEAAEEYEIIATVSLGKEISQALVIITPDNTENETPIYKHHIENLKDFELGDKLFINASENDMQVQLGEDLMLVPKSNSEKYKATKIGKPRVVKLAYQFQNPNEESWQTIGESSYYLEPNTREIIIFYIDVKTDRYNYNGITINIE